MATTLVRAEAPDIHIDTIRIQNVMTSGRLGHFLDIDEIAASLPAGEVDFHQFGGIIYRMKDPEAVLSMYAKGVIVTMSAKSIDESRQAIKKAICRIRKLGIVVNPEPEFMVHNIVATVETNSSINLELASMTLEHTLYEPEHFPWLLYRPARGIAIGVFGQGKMTITGAKTEREVETYAQETVRRLTEIGCMGEYR